MFFINNFLARKYMPKLILFIEDEPTLQKTLGRALEQEGYEVQSALDGQSGLALVKRIKPNLILLDLILPKMDGFAVLKELKKDADTKEIPVIVLTNLESPQDIERALSEGATNYLVKANYELNDVVKKIKELV
ncbi:MAG: response regulator [Candidatus Portnoybacteria bacterium CG08_land_8_20_14_0_20_40_83]|uniref:Response regulator n=3 Tax=Candidatus Portnoyibacteriota TaxID=1817913 RepID=A0A2M7YNY7_9BACT|nr:MAG: response regulator [Candidatus Portnoybacteria bacterium CG11_big_fil_rev_8_21_14_0_20_40_15]PIS29858.1 MAG: response regulator [Candidatus Portnoybacteria bacterium CG08_land_8_20_14_0_20_40_83]PIY74209.1 MAG: response regulator [Candidatus Portnoybacteria bacterium CG_4_10_14_0_8_um_filter_40_50]PJA64612.1 MAG: response regulator [Candidatus Portnoybacteria bacterium CG_4_9_14_3_um_filter_40_10]